MEAALLIPFLLSDELKIALFQIFIFNGRLSAFFIDQSLLKRHAGFNPQFFYAVRVGISTKYFLPAIVQIVIKSRFFSFLTKNCHSDCQPVLSCWTIYNQLIADPHSRLAAGVPAEHNTVFKANDLFHRLPGCCVQNLCARWNLSGISLFIWQGFRPHNTVHGIRMKFSIRGQSVVYWNRMRGGIRFCLSDWAETGSLVAVSASASGVVL